MPEQPQLFFDKTLKSKKELKDLQAVINDDLANSNKYQKITAEIKTLNAKKRQIVEAIKLDHGKEAGKIDTIKADLENDKMLLTDVAINYLVKGKQVEVVGIYGERYAPEFSVKFKKIK